ncbi:MAG: shikimate kinase [Oscillospiraceae bacterium]|nr:shikimate kinase [Oscillospiraceae bacterium]
MRCGLLGRKLGHSYSPQIHGYLGDYSYVLFEKEPEEIEVFLKNGDFTGINVTVPYKKEVIPFLDELSPTARKIGAVNTIVRRADGTFFGHNTDYFGFASMVKRSGLAVSGKKALVLGSGGASNTAVAVLRELGARVIVISRSGENNYDNLHLHADAAVIVNTTPVGMYPNVGVNPVDLSRFPRLEGVLDVVYNPARTQLLLDAEKLGLSTENGLWMLVAQAKEAAEYFTGKPIDDSRIGDIHRKLSVQMQNIVLVGMPGCGKSTIGGMLAEKLGRKFVDADAEIVRLAGKSIPEIFAEDGEEVFREWETKALSELGKQSALIIATGGGCVTKERNYPLLHQNGTIFWLKRALDVLPTDGRPLSQANKLTDMYAIRKPMYEAFTDHAIDNNGAAEETVARILEKLEETP